MSLIHGSRGQLAVRLCIRARFNCLRAWNTAMGRRVEPLHFIDVISRMQIEELLPEQAQAMPNAEHDREFCRKIAA